MRKIWEFLVKLASNASGGIRIIALVAGGVLLFLGLPKLVVSVAGVVSGVHTVIFVVVVVPGVYFTWHMLRNFLPGTKRPQTNALFWALLLVCDVYGFAYLETVIAKSASLGSWVFANLTSLLQRVSVDIMSVPPWAEAIMGGLLITAIFASVANAVWSRYIKKGRKVISSVSLGLVIFYETRLALISPNASFFMRVFARRAMPPILSEGRRFIPKPWSYIEVDRQVEPFDERIVVVTPDKIESKIRLQIPWRPSERFLSNYVDFGKFDDEGNLMGAREGIRDYIVEAVASVVLPYIAATNDGPMAWFDLRADEKQISQLTVEAMLMTVGGYSGEEAKKAEERLKRREWIPIPTLGIEISAVFVGHVESPPKLMSEALSRVAEIEQRDAQLLQAGSDVQSVLALLEPRFGKLTPELVRADPEIQRAYDEQLLLVRKFRMIEDGRGGVYMLPSGGGGELIAAAQAFSRTGPFADPLASSRSDSDKGGSSPEKDGD